MTTEVNSLPRDANDIPVCGGVSDNAAQDILPLLVDDATGALLCSDISGGGGGTPASPDTAVQFNDGGFFGGDSDFTWDKTLNVLTLSNPDGFNIAGYLGLFIGVPDELVNNTTGSDFSARAGKGKGNGGGGSAYLYSGESDLTGNGGGVNLIASDGGVTSGAGGSISLSAGDAIGTNSNGGDINLIPGTKTGVGIAGHIILQNIPASDPGIPGALYHTTGTLKISL